MRSIRLLLALCAAWLAASDDLALELHLLDVLPNRPAPHGAPLSLYLRHVDGSWQRAIALSPNFNTSYHVGQVRSATITDKRLELDLAVEILSDAWVVGGHGRLRLELTRDTDDTWRGRHQARFLGQDRAGQAVGFVHQLPAASKPAASDEHPRLLLREDGLARLRERLAGPLGQAAAPRLDNAVGNGLRWLASGDPAMAERAAEQVRALMADTSTGDKGVAHRVLGWRASQVALAYDCCYHAWPPGFRREVERYLARFIERAFFEHGAFTEYTGWSLSHKLGTDIVARACIATLALRGAPGPAPVEPPPYLGGHDPHTSLGPSDHATGGEALLDDTMPSNWWYLGTHPATAAEQAFAAWRTAPGTGTALNHEALWKGRLAVNKANGNAWNTTNGFAVTFASDCERWVRFTAEPSGGIAAVRFDLDGQPLTDGDVLRLAAGDHQLVAQVTITSTNPWGVIHVGPRWRFLDEATATTALTDRLAAVEDRHATWQAAVAFHQASGGASPHYEELFQIGEAWAFAQARYTIGDGGFAAGEQDMNFVLNSLLPYPLFYRTMHGRDLSPRPDFSHMLAAKCFPFIAGRKGAPAWVQPILTRARWQVSGWFEGGHAGAETFAALWPLSPPELQPALAGLWPEHIERTGVDLASDLVRGRFTKKRGSIDWPPLETHAALALLTAPEAPVTDAPPLPRHWAAPAHGWYAYRKGREADAFVVQAFAKSRFMNKYSRANAGALRVAGLGHEWFKGPADHDRRRFTESVVQLPDDEGLFLDGCGRVSHYATDEHGFTLTVNLADTYARRAGNGPVQPYEGYGALRRPEAFADSGITGLRAIGVDTSGVSGAACLVAIVDRIDGGGRRVWTAQLESRTEPYGKWQVIEEQTGKALGGKALKRARADGSRDRLKPGFAFVIDRARDVSPEFVPTTTADVTVTDRGFHLVQGDASMHATFAAPTDPVIELGVSSLLQKILYGHSRGVERVGSYAVRAEAARGSFFCVLTISRGEHPLVSVAGEGLAAVVTVGDQVVRFDGERLVFGTK